MAQRPRGVTSTGFGPCTKDLGPLRFLFFHIYALHMLLHSLTCFTIMLCVSDGDQWLDVAKNIDHEFFVVKNLQQMTRYYFRLAAKNRVGWSDYGIPIKVKTKPAGKCSARIFFFLAVLFYTFFTFFFPARRCTKGPDHSSHATPSVDNRIWSRSE